MATGYPNPPITEALVDIRVAPLPSAMLPALRALHDGQATAYPVQEELNRVTVHASFQADNPPGHGQTLDNVGYRFVSQDRRQIFQARLDGFTFNRLRPYTGWRQVRSESRRLWDVYREAVCDPAVIRLAVRYINRLDLPLPFGDFGEYLRTVPEVSPKMPQALSRFLMRLEIPLPALHGLAIVTLALEPQTIPERASVILDLDLIRHEDIPSDEDGRWDILESLRTCKNELFEGCITDKTRELFR